MVRAGADIDQSTRAIDQRRQNVGREHINREDAGNSGLRFHPPRLAIADACIVDYGIKATELIDLVGNGSRPGDGRQVPGDSCPSARRLERVASSTVIPPVYDDLMTLLDQDPGRHPTESVR